MDQYREYVLGFLEKTERRIEKLRNRLALRSSRALESRQVRLGNLNSVVTPEQYSFICGLKKLVIQVLDLEMTPLSLYALNSVKAGKTHQIKKGDLVLPPTQVEISVPIDSLPNGYQELLAKDLENFIAKSLPTESQVFKQAPPSKTPRIEKQRASKATDYKHGSVRSEKGNKLFGIFQKSKTTNEDMLARMGDLDTQFGRA